MTTIKLPTGHVAKIDIQKHDAAAKQRWQGFQTIWGMDKRKLNFDALKSTDPNVDYFIEPSEEEIYRLNPGKDGDDRMIAAFKVGKNYTAKDTGEQAFIKDEKTGRFLRVLEVRNGKITKVYDMIRDSNDYTARENHAAELKAQGKHDNWFHGTHPAVIDRLIACKSKGYYEPIAMSVDRMDGLSDKQKTNIKKAIMSALESTGTDWNNDPSKVFQIEQGRLALQAVTHLIPAQYREDFLSRIDGAIDSIYESIFKRINMTNDKDKGDFYSRINSTRELFAEAGNEFVLGNIRKGKVKAIALLNKIKENPATYLNMPNCQALLDCVGIITANWSETLKFV